MGNNLQYLDYAGLAYYDRKLKSQLKSLMPEDGKDGQDGQDGLTPEFQIKDGILQYRYVGQDDDVWVDLGNVKGADGTIGADGTSVTITSTEEVKDELDNVIGIKVNFSDGKNITINHGKDGADGEDADETDLQLGEEIKTNVACGALASGTTLGADLTLAKIVKLLTTKVYEPSIKKAPSATLTMKNQSGSNYASMVEIGTTINPILTPGFNDGKFNSYGKGATSPSDMNAGCVATDYRIYRNSKVGKKETSTQIFDYSDPEGKKPGFTAYANENYKIGDEVISYTTKIEYNASQKSPLDSNGDADTTVKYNAGSIENNTAATATTTTISVGLYNFYKKGSLTTSTDEVTGDISKNEDGDIIISRTNLKKSSNLVTAKANIDYGAKAAGKSDLLGDRSYFFVPAASTTTCPEGYKYKLMADDSAYFPQNNQQLRINGWYKLGVQDSSENWSDLVVKIEDAGGTLRDYHVYKYKSDTPYTDPAFLRFGCVENTKSEASKYVKYENDSDFFA